MIIDVQRFRSVTSTMDVAAAAVQAGAAEGLVIVADEQTAGRGRRGRHWSSPAGAGLYLSIVLRPPCDGSDESRLLPLITLAAGVGVRDAVAAATGLEAELKWPNDLVVQRRKLAGMLAEGFALGTAGQAVVLGIGVNVTSASYPPDVAARATSLESELGRCVDPGGVRQAILDAVPDQYERLRRGGADDILRAWRAAAPSAHGARVEWERPDGVQQGVTAGIDDEGALLVQTTRGLDRVISGEMRWP